MGNLIYILCALTALACAWLLWRNYRQNRLRLLMWSGLCFVGLSLHNLLRAIGQPSFIELDMLGVRVVVGLVSLLLLLYGLIWEDEA